MILFEQDYSKQEGPTIALSLTMFNTDFDPTNFITEASAEGCKQVTWTSK